MSFASAKLYFNRLEIWAVVIVHEISEVVEMGFISEIGKILLMIDLL